MGKTLMGCLDDIARRWNMRKIMLTVFKGENASVSLGLSRTQRLFGREPGRILILQGYRVGYGYLIYMCKALILYNEASTLSQMRNGWMKRKMWIIG